MTALPILLIAAVQGLLLFGLHLALEQKAWPATDLKWLVPLYAIAVLAPLTLQLAAERLRESRLWVVAAAVALAAGTLGAYTGWTAEPLKDGAAAHATSLFVFYFVFFIAWFVAMPFAQTGLRTGALSFPYHDLFEFAWHNELLLLEAALFTGVFWGLLALWAALFKIVDIAFFAELFVMPGFVYPVTALTFGYAMYLIQSRISIVVTLRRHVHGVFSWLFPLVAAIAVMFLAVLPFTGLEPLWRTGNATFLMLWLQALLLLFLNAAYEDGASEPGYPEWLKKTLRAGVLAMPVYAALCAYSLGLRIEQHGWTVDRVWAALITLVVFLYGSCYAAAAFRRSSWMAGMARVNVVMAWVLVALLLLMLSPALDPKRVSASSQLSRLAAGKVAPDRFDYDYLRRELGRYGTGALAGLAGSEDGETARRASAALAGDGIRPRREEAPAAKDIAGRIDVYPKGGSPDPAFLEYLSLAAREHRADHPPCLTMAQQRCVMLMLDLDSDAQPEMIFFSSGPPLVYGRLDDKWTRIGRLTGGDLSAGNAADLLRKSKYRAERPAWSTLVIGDQRYTVEDQRAEK